MCPFIVLAFALLCGNAAVAQTENFLEPQLLEDLYPGVEASDPSLIFRFGSTRGYFMATVPDQPFRQLFAIEASSDNVVQQVGEFTTSNRGDPFATDPFWTDSSGFSPVRLGDVLYLFLFDYDLQQNVLWSASKESDQHVLSRWNQTVFGSSEELRSLVTVFKDQLYAFMPYNGIASPPWGLTRFSSGFEMYEMVKNKSAFYGIPELDSVPDEEFFGLTSGSILGQTTELLLLSTRVEGNGGIYGYDGSFVFPIHTPFSSFDLLMVEEISDAEERFFFTAKSGDEEPLGREQLYGATITPSGASFEGPSRNVTVVQLTDLSQNCIRNDYNLRCFLNFQRLDSSRYVFTYNRQLGITDGVSGDQEGTFLITGQPPIDTRTVLVASAHVLFKEDLGEPQLYVSDGTQDGTVQLQDGDTLVLGTPLFVFQDSIFISSEGAVWRMTAVDEEEESFQLDKLEGATSIKGTLFEADGLLYCYQTVNTGRGNSYTNFMVSNGTHVGIFYRRSGSLVGGFLNLIGERIVLVTSTSEYGAELYYFDLLQYVPFQASTSTDDSSGVSTVSSALLLFFA
ncbi:hypothetical protein QOT17_009709 [Balamuthia mandrillaris]